MNKQKIKVLLTVTGLYSFFVLCGYLIGKYSGIIGYYISANLLNSQTTYQPYAYIVMMTIYTLILLIMLGICKIKLKDCIKFYQFNTVFVFKLFIIQIAILFLSNINSAKDINDIIDGFKYWVEALQGKKFISYDSFFIRRNDIDLSFFAILYTIILGPLIEEIFYKHVIYNKLKNIFPVKIAMIIIGILFFSQHLPYYGLKTNLLSFIFGGIITAYCYEKTKTVWASVMIHSGYNAYVTFHSLCTLNFIILLFLIFFITTIIIVAVDIVKYLKRRTAGNAVIKKDINL